MPLEKKIFAGGGMDMDTDERFVAKNDYRDALNCRIITSDEGNSGVVENIRSNKKFNNIKIGSSDICIGAYEDLSNGSVIYFILAADGNDGIYKLNTGGGVETILQHPILNFHKNYLITGINIVGDDEDVFPDGLLYWTDDYNPPRRLNILKSKLYNAGSLNPIAYSGMDKQTLDAIKYPPTQHPGIGQGSTNPYRTDTSKPSNQLIEKAWQFKYRYVYDDLEKSAWSPISTCAMDASFSAVYSTGVDAQENNVIPILFNTGHHTVERIQLAARNSNGRTDFILIADIDKKKVNELVSNMGLPPSFDGDNDFVKPSNATGAPNEIVLDETLPDSVTRFFFFYNDSVYSTIDVVESDKLYDDVPHLAKAQEVVDGNRMVYGNVVTGQTVDETMDISLNPVVPKDPLLDFNTETINNVIHHRVGSWWGDSSGYKNKYRKNLTQFEMKIDISVPTSVTLGAITSYYFSVPNFMLQYAIVRCIATNGWSGYDKQKGFLGIFNIEYSHTTASIDPTVIAADMVAELNAKWYDTSNPEVGWDTDLPYGGHMACNSGYSYPASDPFSSSGSTIELKIRLDKTEKYIWRPKGSCGIRSQIIGGPEMFSNDDTENGPPHATWKDWLWDDYKVLTKTSAVNQWESEAGSASARRPIGVQIASGEVWRSGLSTNGENCIHGSSYDAAHSNATSHMSFWGISGPGVGPFGSITYSSADPKYLYSFVSHKANGDWPDWVDAGISNSSNYPNGMGPCSLFALTSSEVDKLNAIMSGVGSLGVVDLIIESISPTVDSSAAVVGSFKTGARHRFGLVYYDEGNRSSSVQLALITNTYIPRATDIGTTYDNIFYDDGTPTTSSYIDANGNTVQPLNTTGYFGEWGVQWEINHEPPDWATHYQWVYGGNTLTDDFVHFVTDGFFSGRISDTSNTVLTPTGETDYTGGNALPIVEQGYRDNILVDITNIRQHQKAQGSAESFRYDWKEGDIVRFLKDGNLVTETPAINEPYEFKVLGVVGERDFPRIIKSDESTTGFSGQTSGIFDDRDFIVLSRERVLTVVGVGTTVVNDTDPIAVFKNYVLEIYSPKKKTEEDKSLYYEFGHLGRIGLDGSNKRIHKRIGTSYQNQIIGTQPATGIFTRGDSYLFNRSSYSAKVFVIVESFNFNDKFKSDYWDKGRPNAVLEDFKRTRKHSTCLYSDPYIPNTNINGLNSFYPDVTFAEFERNYNSIQKLYSKDNKLIIFQEDKVSQSLVKRDIIYNVDGSGNVATTDSVLSQSVPYLGKYGINKNPESFAAHGNRMYFADVKRGAVLRLSLDGFSQISSNKMQEYFTDKFESIHKSRVSTGAGIHHSILGVYDIRFREYIVSSTAIWRWELELDKNGNWVLVKKEVTEQPFTIGFSEVNKRWNSFYSYAPEIMCGRRTGIVTFKNGDIYGHNDKGAGYNTFYGTLYPSQLEVLSNEVPSNNKIYQAFSEESDDIWDVEFKTKNNQLSTLSSLDFDKRENIYYSDILNDVNSPGGIIEGDRIRDVSLVAKLNISQDTFTRLFGVNFNIVPSHRSNK